MTMTHCSCNQAQMIFPPQPPEWLEPQPWQILSVFPNGTKEEVTSKEDEEEEMDEDIEDLDHYEMKEEPISGKKLEDEGTEKENWAMLEKIRKTERQGHLNVYVLGGGALCMEPLTKQLLLSKMKKVSQQFGRLRRADHEIRRSRPSWLTR
ncbi:ubiquitin-conjugating enzyme E2 Q2-like isoform X2 [Pongo abelii]